jgi:hypothetical protein
MADTGTGSGAPRIAPQLALYTLARLGIAVVVIGLLVAVGLPLFPALLFGLLLQLPLSYVLLRPIREKLTVAMADRGERRKAEKAQLRERLAGTETDA